MSLYDIKGNLITSKQVTDSFFDIVYPEHTNIFDPTKYTPNLIMNNYGNSDNTISCGGAYLTDLIDVSEHIGEYVYAEHGEKNAGNPHTTYTAVLHYSRINFYNADKNQISWCNGENEMSPQQVPEGAVYMRVSFCQRYGTNALYPIEEYFIGFAKDNTAEVLPFEFYYSEGEVVSAYLKHDNFTYTDESQCKGKKWVLFGDSLTDGYGGHDWEESTSSVGGVGWKETEEKVPWTGYFWATKIARETGLIIDNRAKSGSNINVGNNGNYADVCGVNMLDAFIAEIESGAEQPYLISVHFGSNAITSQCGTSADTSATTSTVCGATKYFIEKLREHCPNSIILFVLPPQSDWGSNSTVKSVTDGRNAIKSVLDLDEYSVPYIDMWKESGITVDMLPDGIHISSIEAQNKYCYIMRKAII